MSTEGTTLVDTLFGEQKELIAFLQQQGQLSYSQRVEVSLSKTLVLSGASYFESRITNAISDYAARVSKSDEALTSLVRTKAIERQYLLTSSGVKEAEAQYRFSLCLGLH